MASLYLSNGEKVEVDEVLLPILSNFEWHKTNAGYAACSIRKKYIYLHRFVLGLAFSKGKGSVVDHIDGNGLNNKVSNLRTCSHAENMKNQKLQKNNKSGFKGVSMVASTKKYKAFIMFNGKNRLIGTFESPVDAAKAYDRYAIDLHGEFARLNFPDEAA